MNGADVMSEFASEWHSNFSRAKSSLSKALSEETVLRDLIERGYDPHQGKDRDSIHDCTIEIAPDWWLKVQIKSCYGNNTYVNLTTRGTTKTAPVSPGKNSKPRTSTGYYNSGIHLMAVVTDTKVLYYDISSFGSLQEKFNWKKVHPIVLETYINRLIGDVAELADTTDLKSVEG